MAHTYAYVVVRTCTPEQYRNAFGAPHVSGGPLHRLKLLLFCGLVAGIACAATAARDGAFTTPASASESVAAGGAGSGPSSPSLAGGWIGRALQEAAADVRDLTGAAGPADERHAGAGSALDPIRNGRGVKIIMSDDWPVRPAPALAPAAVGSDAETQAAAGSD